MLVLKYPHPHGITKCLLNASLPLNSLYIACHTFLSFIRLGSGL